MTATLRDKEKGRAGDCCRVSGVEACSGEFVEVAARLFGSGSAVHGWSLRPCAAQLTTCDCGGRD